MSSQISGPASASTQSAQHFIPQTLPVIIVFGLFFGFLLHNTPFGRRTLAIGQSPMAARFAGVNVVRHKIIIFTFTGFMSGVAGVIYTFRFSTAQADNGVGLELLVISACLLGGVSIFGGVGTMWGVVAGVFLASSVESWLTLRESTHNGEPSLPESCFLFLFGAGLGGRVEEAKAASNNQG
jgi:rhamnose transport system permease protein